MPQALHLLFDVLAAALAFAATWAAWHWRLKSGPGLAQITTPYALALLAGALIGGVGLGTANLALSGLPGPGRSILGAMAGAITAVEAYKYRRAITTSTGLIFVASFPVSVMIGRIECHLSGLADNTHGIATTLPWGHDFGDGVPRHPVQLYESALMALFVAYAITAAHRRAPFFMRNGFYLMVAAYAAQRFGLEFLKPYASVAGPLNLFQLVCAGLLVYAWVMIRRSRHV